MAPRPAHRGNHYAHLTKTDTHYRLVPRDPLSVRLTQNEPFLARNGNAGVMQKLAVN